MSLHNAHAETIVEMVDEREETDAKTQETQPTRPRKEKGKRKMIKKFQDINFDGKLYKHKIRQPIAKQRRPPFENLSSGDSSLPSKAN